jgi:Flp pilus assembly protein TadG
MDAAAMTIFRRHDLRSADGQTAVEFALLAPMLIALLLGIVQGGIAFHNYITVTDAARTAARQAVELRVSNVTAADVTQAAKDAAGGLDVGVQLQDTSDPSFVRAGSTLTVTVTYPYSINILGVVVSSGTLTSTMTGRLE